eukprot:m51a1_g13724 hypothetical protein (262) ;mRNA; f:113980-116238
MDIEMLSVYNRIMEHAFEVAELCAGLPPYDALRLSSAVGDLQAKGVEATLASSAARRPPVAAGAAAVTTAAPAGAAGALQFVQKGGGGSERPTERMSQTPQGPQGQQPRDFSAGAPLEGADRYVLWVDDKGGQERFQKEVRDVLASSHSKKIGVRVFATAGGVAQWLKDNGAKPGGGKAKLRVVTNRYRAGDGGDSGAERTVLAVRAEAHADSVPIAVYCSDTSKPGIAELAKKKRVYIITDPKQLFYFVSKGKPREPHAS